MASEAILSTYPVKINGGLTSAVKAYPLGLKSAASRIDQMWMIHPRRKTQRIYFQLLRLWIGPNGGEQQGHVIQTRKSGLTD